MSGYYDLAEKLLDQKIIDYNRANSGIPRYRSVISGRDFDDVFMVDTNELGGAIEESKSIVISRRNLTLIETRFLRVDAQILPLS